MRRMIDRFIIYFFAQTVPVLLIPTFSSCSLKALLMALFAIIVIKTTVATITTPETTQIII